MSRIGKKSIKIPEGVEVKIENNKITAVGPKGRLERSFDPFLDFLVGEKEISIGPRGKSDLDSRTWGLNRALLANMIKGVSAGFEKTLEFSGVGFKAQVKGDILELNLGFSHPVEVKASEGVTFQTDKNTIKISGINKAEVGQVAASIRAIRPPEPYKGRGVKYKEEVIRRKTGKKAAAAGA